MNRQPHPFFRTWIVTATVAVVAWWLVPGSSLDRKAFKVLAHRQAASPVEISGKGSHSEPWKWRTEMRGAQQTMAWDLITLMDPVDATFQGWPHAPIDLALIFSNLQRLGARQLTCAVLLAWEQPDPIGLAAMERTLSKFDSVVIAAPITRGAVMGTLPPPFRRASRLVEDLTGDASMLPRVNRVSVPNLIYGGQNTLAGFQVIDSEPDGGRMPLLARWDYRVVLAFPLVAVMQRLGLEVEDLQIEIGSHIRLGEKGLSIPIDDHGRLAIPQAPNQTPAIRAEELIDAQTGTFDHPVLIDSRSQAEQVVRNYQLAIPTALHTLQTAQVHLQTRTFARWSAGLELPLLLLGAIGISTTVMAGRFLHGLICLSALVICPLGGYYGMRFGVWLPALPGAVTILAAWICCLLWGKKRRRTTSMPRLDRLKFQSLNEGG